MTRMSRIPLGRSTTDANRPTRGLLIVRHDLRNWPAILQLSLLWSSHFDFSYVVFLSCGVETTKTSRAL